MPGRTSASVVLGIIGTAEEADVIDRIHMIPQLAAAICTVEIICQQMLWAVFCLWRSAFCLSDTLLHLFPDFPLDDGFMDILEYCPIFLRMAIKRMLWSGK